MKAKRTCRLCWLPFDADVNEDGDGQTVCGPCDAAFNVWMDAKLEELGDEAEAHILNTSERARLLSQSVLDTIDSLDCSLDEDDTLGHDWWPALRRLPERLRLLQIAALRRIDAMRSGHMRLTEADDPDGSLAAVRPVIRLVDGCAAALEGKVGAGLTSYGELIARETAAETVLNAIPDGWAKVDGRLVHRENKDRPRLADDWLPGRLRELGISEDCIAELIEFVDGPTAAERAARVELRKLLEPYDPADYDGWSYWDVIQSMPDDERDRVLELERLLFETELHEVDEPDWWKDRPTSSLVEAASAATPYSDAFGDWTGDAR